LTFHVAMPWMLPFSKAAMSDDEQERFNRLTSKLQSRIAMAFREAVARLGERVDIKALADLLAQNRVSEALALINERLVIAGMWPIGTAISAALVEAGQAAALVIDAIPALRGVDITFGLTNPETINHLRIYEMNTIRELSAQALGSVRLAITTGVQEGRNPIDVARDVRQHIGLTERQSGAVLNYRRMLEGRDRTALQRQLRDKRFDGTVSRAIAADAPLKPEQIKRMVERYRDRSLKMRSETIARTEAIRAVNSGNVLAWRQAIADGKVDASAVVKQWVYTHDSRTRNAHRTIPGLNPKGVGLDQAFQSELGPIQYPGDPNADAANVINCRCSLVIRYRPSRSA